MKKENGMLVLDWKEALLVTIAIGGLIFTDFVPEFFSGLEKYLPLILAPFIICGLVFLFHILLWLLQKLLQKVPEDAIKRTKGE